MPKVSDEYREQRRREIADAALKAFRRKGFQAASMADIIAESGLSAGAIYGHYPSKDELIKAVALTIIGGRTQAFEVLAMQPDRPSPAQAVRPFLDGIVAQVGDTAILIQMWGEAATNPALFEFVHDVIGRLLGAFAGYLESWYRDVRGLAPERARELAVEQAPLFVSTCQGFILQSSFVPDFDVEAYLAAAEKYLPG